MNNSAFIYKYYMYRWHDYRNVSAYGISCYLCCMSLAVCISTVVCIYVDIMQLWIYLYHCLCPIISLHPHSYNIAGCDLHLIVW